MSYDPVGAAAKVAILVFSFMVIFSLVSIYNGAKNGVLLLLLSTLLMSAAVVTLIWSSKRNKKDSRELEMRRNKRV